MNYSRKHLYWFLLKGKISIWFPCIFSQYAWQWLDKWIFYQYRCKFGTFISSNHHSIGCNQCFVTLTIWRNQKQHVHVGYALTYWDFEFFALSKFSNNFHTIHVTNKLLTLISYKIYIVIWKPSAYFLVCVFSDNLSIFPTTVLMSLK